MVDMSIAGGVVTFRVRGLHKLWALKSKIRVPLRSIVAVDAGERAAQEARGWRLFGSWIPGLLTAGTFARDGQWWFWDVVRPDRALAITLREHRYSRLIIEAADPKDMIVRLGQALVTRIGAAEQ
jgi:hypothetical protein